MFRIMGCMRDLSGVLGTVCLVFTFVLISCKGESGLTPAELVIPRNVWIQINDGADATRDTVLRVVMGGENVDRMQLSSDSSLCGAPWELFVTERYFNAPRVEGSFTIYARFASSGGGTTGVISDDITLDFTAVIRDFEVSAPGDTVSPGDRVVFTMETGEAGDADVSFGDVTHSYPLHPLDAGRFRRELVVPRGVPEHRAVAVGRFIDAVGNRADSAVFRRAFTILGPHLRPRICGRLTLRNARMSDIWCFRGFCFVSDWQRAVHIIDVSDPTDLKHIDLVSTSDWTQGLDGNGELLVAADSHSGLVVIGIVPPEEAAIIGRKPVGGMPKDVIIDDQIIYAATYNTGFRIFDLHDPRHLIELSRTPTTCNGVTICKNGDIVYVAGVGGMSIFDAKDPEQPEMLSELFFETEILSILYYEGYVFAATTRFGVLTIDVCDPENPRSVASHHHLCSASGLAESAPFLFVVRGDTLSIVNITLPEQLPVMFEVPGLTGGKSVFEDNGYLYVAGGAEFTVINLFQE